jgi:DNA-directed RNA polymerase specialized sigma24 family protein
MIKLEFLVDDDVNEKMEEELMLKIKVTQVEKILNQINLEDKSVLLMKYSDDLGIQEIGEILNKSNSAVKMKLLRARERFLNVYKQQYHGIHEE